MTQKTEKSKDLVEPTEKNIFSLVKVIKQGCYTNSAELVFMGRHFTSFVDSISVAGTQ